MQQLGFQLYNQEEAFEIFQLRKQLQSHHLSSDSIVGFLHRIRSEEQAYLSQFTHGVQRESFITVLEAFKDKWIQERGYIPKPAKTCADVLLQTGATQLLRQARSFYNKGMINSFVSYYDYVDGMMEICGSVLSAINALEGKSEKVADKAAIHLLKQHKSLPSDVMDEFDEVTGTESQYLEDLFTQDSSGLLLVNQVIKLLQQEAKTPQVHHRMLPYQYPELILAGAQFGKQIYEALYHVWGRES